MKARSRGMRRLWSSRGGLATGRLAAIAALGCLVFAGVATGVLGAESAASPLKLRFGGDFRLHPRGARTQRGRLGRGHLRRRRRRPCGARLLPALGRRQPRRPGQGPGQGLEHRQGARPRPPQPRPERPRQDPPPLPAAAQRRGDRLPLCAGHRGPGADRVPRLPSPIRSRPRRPRKSPRTGTSCRRRSPSIRNRRRTRRCWRRPRCPTSVRSSRRADPTAIRSRPPSPRRS